MIISLIVQTFILIGLCAGPAAQPSVEESKSAAEALIASALKELGGENYLGVRSERARGIVTPYKDGSPDSLGVQSFVDYILLPDKERVEFKGRGRRVVQSNFGAQGWVYDSDSEILRDQTDAQLNRFVKGMRRQVDQILRGGWRAPDVRLRCLPKQEIWPKQDAEGIELIYSDGDQVEIFFEPKTTLPLSVRYSKEDGKGAVVKAENRFFKYIEIGGVKAPYVVDLFENGAQTLRINYEERLFNASVPDKLFVKPESAKALK